MRVRRGRCAFVHCVLIVKMYVCVREAAVPVLVYVDRAAPAQGTHERVRAEQYDHQRDAELKPRADAIRDGYAQDKHDDADNDERRRMPRAPERTYECRAPEFALFAHNVCDGDDVINFGRVFETEDETDGQSGQRARCGQLWLFGREECFGLHEN